MSSSSRRRFLGVAGAGAAVAGATAITPSAFAAGHTALSSRSAHEPVVAYVEDASSGKVTLHVGEREVVVHDHELANRLLNAAGRS